MLGLSDGLADGTSLRSTVGLLDGEVLGAKEDGAGVSGPGGSPVELSVPGESPVDLSIPGKVFGSGSSPSSVIVNSMVAA